MRPREVRIYLPHEVFILSNRKIRRRWKQKKSQDRWKNKAFQSGWKKQTNKSFYEEIISSYEEQQKQRLKKINDKWRSLPSPKENKSLFMAFISEVRSHFMDPIPELEIEKQSKDKRESGGEEQSPDKQTFSRTSSSGLSKIENEFDILENLGEGTYGSVIKVRNKFESNEYAIKLVRLDTKDEKLMDKYKREAAVLAKLKHDHVVRYFGSWLEKDITSFASEFGINISPSPTVSGITDEQIIVSADIIKRQEEEILENKLHESEYSDEDYDIDDLSDEGEGADCSSESDSSIVFENDEVPLLDEASCLPDLFSKVDIGDMNSDDTDSKRTNSQPDQCSKDETDDKNCDDDSKQTHSQLDQCNKDDAGNKNTDGTDCEQIQWMCIQMEFCKSNLWVAIGDGLYKNEKRVWKLFREMIAGLAYIHEQGYVHRDLKPMNIFLDSNDCVKIGDFGFARNINVSSVPFLPQLNIVKNVDRNMEEGNSLSSYVGTYLYDAPELRIRYYDKKVDMYSLGVIFFEMCYPPPSTGTERIKILKDLRDRQIILPSDFNLEKNPQQYHIIKLLLNHDPTKRPSSLGLLNSGYVPPSKQEEAKLQETVRHTLCNPKSTAYKYVVGSCFRQDTNEAEDIIYDINFFKSTPPLLILQDVAKKRIKKVFEKHGAIDLSTPLLMPHNALYNDTLSCVQLMTTTGCVVTLPHDLCVPFARFVAWNGITDLRRYSFDKVYKEQDGLYGCEILYGFHPKEFWECTFDIVTPNPGNLMVEAELLSIVWNIVNEFHSLKSKSLIIRLNHTSLLKAILMYGGIEEDKFTEAYSLLKQTREKIFTKDEVKTWLANLSRGFTEMSLDSFLFWNERLKLSSKFDLLMEEGNISHIAKKLSCITREKSNATHLARKGLDELKVVISIARDLGVKCPIVVTPYLVHNVEWYSGMMFQFTYKEEKGRLHVIGSGGKYDAMIASFRKKVESVGLTSEKKLPSAAGITLSLSKLVFLLNVDEDIPPAADVAVCLRKDKEKAFTMKKLWSANIKCTLVDHLQTVEEMQSYCLENSIQHAVVQKEKEKDKVIVLNWNEEEKRFQEREVQTAALVNVLQQLLESKDGRTETLNVSASEEQSTGPTYSPSTKKSLLNFTFITKAEYPYAMKKMYELQMQTHVLNYISPKAHAEVLAVHIEKSVVMDSLASHLELHSDRQKLRESIGPFVGRFPQDKTYLIRICSEIYRLKREKSSSSIILYNVYDRTFKFFM
ncbi:eIF-2-alpha kinase GCN2-like [Periplaneta americana]|uniref:eIF-2-alpha kinase GCN2-like n=1 Tax=Periplaneta americana TaxID=6978 RepID=UPI0037E7350D